MKRFWIKDAKTNELVADVTVNVESTMMDIPLRLDVDEGFILIDVAKAWRFFKDI
jgi:hypothetical protein